MGRRFIRILLHLSLVLAVGLGGSGAFAQTCPDSSLREMRQRIETRKTQIDSREQVLRAELAAQAKARDSSDRIAKAVDAFKFSMVALGLGIAATPLIKRVTGRTLGSAAIAAGGGAGILIAGRQLINSLVGAASMGIAAGERTDRPNFNDSSTLKITLAALGVEELGDRRYSAAASELVLTLNEYEAGHRRIDEGGRHALDLSSSDVWRAGHQIMNHYEVKKRDLAIQAATTEAHLDLVHREQVFLADLSGRVEAKCRLESSRQSLRPRDDRAASTATGSKRIPGVVSSENARQTPTSAAF